MFVPILSVLRVDKSGQFVWNSYTPSHAVILVLIMSIVSLQGLVHTIHLCTMTKLKKS